MAARLQFVYPLSLGVRPEDMPNVSDGGATVTGDQVRLVFYEGNIPGAGYDADELFEQMIDQAERAIIAYYDEKAITE